MNTEKKVNIYQVLSAIEENVVGLERTRDLLQLLDEQFIDILSKGEPWADSYFVDRFQLLRSLLDAIKIQFTGSIASTIEALDEGFTIIRNNKAIEHEG